MDSAGGSDSLARLVGKAEIVLARAEKKKGLARDQCGAIGAQDVLALLAEVTIRQGLVTTIREFPLTLTWFLTWSINPLLFTLLRHPGGCAGKTKKSARFLVDSSQR